MICENQTTGMRSGTVSAAGSPTVSTPTTPSFVRKFQSNFRPLDLRKISLYNTHESSSFSSSTCTSASSQDSSPCRHRPFSSRSFHSSSQDSFMLKRQTSQTRLRESLLASLLSPRFALPLNDEVFFVFSYNKKHTNLISNREF